jgi:hypothetical protein
MHLELLPLLQVQRDLLREERGPGRFQSYLKAMRDERGELRLPLSGFNPMSKPHVAELLDRLIAMDAEGIAAEAMRESVGRIGVGLASSLPHPSRMKPRDEWATRASVDRSAMPAYRFGLVVADDAKGGWTNRYLFEAKERFENRYAVTHGFITALLWSSEEPTAERVRQETAAAIYRTAWIGRWGLPRTLGEMLRQEGLAARFAGVEAEGVDAAVEAVVRGHLESTDYPTMMACLYGDAAAEALGYGPVGASERAGLRFAGSVAFLGTDDPVAELGR